MIFVVLSLLVGCKKEENKPTTPTTPSTPSETEEPAIPSGNIATPDWQVPSDYDYSSSMTVVAQVDLTLSYSTLTANDWQVDDGDLLAAFAGNECLGVAKPIDGLFYLYITSPSDDSEEITLKYYSARLRNIFQTDTHFSFVNGDRLGSVNEPMRPLFESI